MVNVGNTLMIPNSSMIPDSSMISDSSMMLFVLDLVIFLHGLFSLAGVMGNLINLAVFRRQGLKDSMSVGFYALSLSDFCYCVLNLGMCACFAAGLVLPGVGVDFVVVNEVCFTWTKYIAYLSSYWITVVISVERCVCVTFPFHVRRLFTRARCVAAVLLIFVVNTGLHAPIYANEGFVWREVTPSPGAGNATAMVMEMGYLPGYAKVMDVVDAADVSLMIICELLIITCAVLMINALKSSSLIRNKITAPTISGLENKSVSEPDPGSGQNLRKMKPNLSDRERKLIQMVSLLAVYQALCNVPHFAVIAGYHAWMKFLCDDENDVRLQIVLWRISDLFHVVCACMTVLVYWKLNLGYKSHMKKMFGWK